MSLFNQQILTALAKFDPALARAGEIALYAVLVYLMSAVLGQEAFTFQALLTVTLTPLLAWAGKRHRDLLVQDKE
jgi:hypothetical protein